MDIIKIYYNKLQYETNSLSPYLYKNIIKEFINL